ncbi:hypothetical protein MTR_4g011650 [Medicago truncatula]|uniref:Uncharacterized protein n=2 Tax=Medicago truncatula TaxID=3880 RepID=A0A072US92_MEDTR|nr:hypothetical protein MTR_4g011650 [Medicago truncatula]
MRKGGHGEKKKKRRGRPKTALSDQQINQYVPTAELFFVDAACFTGGITGWGMVAYNQSGVVQSSAWKREAIEIDPVSVETLGVRWWLQYTAELNL